MEPKAHIQEVGAFSAMRARVACQWGPTFQRVREIAGAVRESQDVEVAGEWIQDALEYARSPEGRATSVVVVESVREAIVTVVERLAASDAPREAPAE